jgi:glycosyltransferase involved in cell wall biosynthesis
MTILFCQPTLEYSGSERSLLDIVEGLRAEAPHELLLLAGKDGPIRAEFERSVASVTLVDAPKLSRRLGILPRYVASFGRTHAAIRRLKRERGVSLVYVNTSMFPQALLGAALCGIPRVVHVHEVATTYPAWYYRLVTGMVSRFATRIVTVCDYIGRQKQIGSRSRFAAKAVVIRNSSAYAAGPAERTIRRPARLLSVIPVTRRKGIEELGECARLLSRALGPGAFQWTVVGRIAEPSVHARVAAELADAGLADAVRFHGAETDLTQYYAAADILVHPSRSEAFPRTLVEAANFSLPVVVTDAGGSREGVRDGHTGFIVPVGDAQAMADRIRKLIGDPDLYRRMSRQAQQHFQREFTRARMIARLRDVIERA